MYRSAGGWIINFIVFGLFVMLTPSELYAEGQAKHATAPKGLQQRIDFGNARILGQSIKSGAVYLMHRKKSDIKNMLEVRQHYRDEIKEDFDIDQTAISQGTQETQEDSKQ